VYVIYYSYILVPFCKTHLPTQLSVAKLKSPLYVNYLLTTKNHLLNEFNNNHNSLPFTAGFTECTTKGVLCIRFQIADDSTSGTQIFSRDMKNNIWNTLQLFTKQVLLLECTNDLFFNIIFAVPFIHQKSTTVLLFLYTIQWMTCTIWSAMYIYICICLGYPLYIYIYT